MRPNASAVTVWITAVVGSTWHVGPGDGSGGLDRCGGPTGQPPQIYAKFAADHADLDFSAVIETLRGS
ncbi:3-hydroxyisobutyrate dehydrogenase [Mycobacterium tuberculosis]|nr:3-hydroxyisobutyrate dehydrogenase [Mycobacterium tuberculosis]CKP32041.1 3-hydroxyisobutyrate dehydrogenase [Mycobacterium tuberculosis]